MNTDLAKRTILPAYIKYQDDLNADESSYKKLLLLLRKYNSLLLCLSTDLNLIQKTV